MSTVARWVQAEHRVNPELLVAQTGSMQGASGIGMWVLHLHAFDQRRSSPVMTFPTTHSRTAIRAGGAASSQRLGRRHLRRFAAWRNPPRTVTSNGSCPPCDNSGDMRFFATPTLTAGVLVLSVACHPGPVLNTEPQQSVGGTIAGAVRATSGSVALVGRKVTVLNVTTGVRYETTTSVGGGYTIKVPEGTYRIDVELRESETLVKRPDETHVNNGDLDPGRDFDIAVKP